VVNFLANAVLHLAPHRFGEASSIPGFFPSPDFQTCPQLTLDSKKARGLSIRTPSFGELNAGSPDEQAKVDLLALSLNLLNRFADMYKSLDGFLELYQPIQEILSRLSTNDLSESLRVCISSL
jgi:nucleolar protein 14